MSRLARAKLALSFALASTLLVTACSTGTEAMVASLRRVVSPGADVDTFPLDPKLPYIRTTHAGRVGFAWRGITERSPEGPVEVYYSSSGEVLKLANGRIVSAAGFKTEWRRVTNPTSSWSELAASRAPVSLTRVRDVMPGYRFGVQDQLLVRVIPPPEKSLIRNVDPQKLTWFEERTASSSGATVRRTMVGADAADTWLPPARYAVDLSLPSAQVVYAEQCLAADLCLTWQRWSAAMQKPPKPAS